MCFRVGVKVYLLRCFFPGFGCICNNFIFQVLSQWLLAGNKLIEAVNSQRFVGVHDKMRARTVFHLAA